MSVSRVLECYPAPLVRGAVEVLGNHGGFSGANLWRLHAPGGPLCLRRCGPGEVPDQVAWRHRLMQLARDSGLGFVPRVHAARNGDTLVTVEGQIWELQEWLPGEASYQRDPSEQRLRAAAGALARLHTCWTTTGTGVCPAVFRRLKVAQTWRGWARSGDALRDRAGEMANRWIVSVPGLLAGLSVPVELQPCVRDVWHDHLLFRGEELSGLVDYGNLGVDHVAVDLARMLGSLEEDDEAGWQIGLGAYRQIRPLSLAEERLARVLDRTGVIVALANWLGRPWTERGRSQVLRLLERVQRWR